MKLQDYLDLAEKLLLKYHCSYIDDDAIGYVAGYMMKADEKFDGRGNIEGFRWSYGKCGMLNYINRERKKITDNALSLNTSVNNANHYSIIDLISDKPTNRFDINLVNDIIEFVDMNLKDSQKKCINMRFIDGLTLQEIGSRLGITREAVRQNINRGLNTIKHEFC